MKSDPANSCYKYAQEDEPPHYSNDEAMYQNSARMASLQNNGARSKKVTKRRRRTIAKDQKTIRITRVSWLLPPAAGRSALVVTNPPPTEHPKPANDDKRPAEKPARRHAWEHTTDIGKVVFANRALAQEGRAYAFTLNLSPKEIAAANDNAKGFTDYFKRRISRNLKRMAGLVDALAWFVVDVTNAGRLHLHGALAANENELEAVKRALKAAGGVWEPASSRQYQCQIKPVYTPDVWATYCLRNQAKVRRLITGKSISITTTLRRCAKELWARGSLVPPPPRL